ncbi:hypothetical protein VKT23_014046 [Stygiomarasmius scandens]|uniref:F-box protein n=1 Tax=Marasmiellus scandens TaxID=2682957 RepID=A0ABR1J6I1_9AGAR
MLRWCHLPPSVQEQIIDCFGYDKATLLAACYGLGPAHTGYCQKKLCSKIELSITDCEVLAKLCCVLSSRHDLRCAVKDLTIQFEDPTHGTLCSRKDFLERLLDLPLMTSIFQVTLKGYHITEDEYELQDDWLMIGVMHQLGDVQVRRVMFSDMSMREGQWFNCLAVLRGRGMMLSIVNCRAETAGYVSKTMDYDLGTDMSYWLEDRKPLQVDRIHIASSSAALCNLLIAVTEGVGAEVVELYDSGPGFESLGKLLGNVKTLIWHHGTRDGDFRYADRIIRVIVETLHLKELFLNLSSAGLQVIVQLSTKSGCWRMIEIGSPSRTVVEEQQFLVGEHANCSLRRGMLPLREAINKWVKDRAIDG